MKKTSCIGLTLCVTVLLLGSTSLHLTAATPNPSTITLTYTFGTPQLSIITIEQERYDTVSLPGSAAMGRAGDPSLPAIGAYILLPPQTTVTSVSAHGSRYSLGQGYHVVPIGESLPLTKDPVTPTPNPEVYASDAAFPAYQCAVEGVYQLRGFSILVVSLYPVQYRPASGELLAYPSFEVTVSLAPTASASPLYRGLPQDFDEVRSRVDNPELLSAYPSHAPLSSSADLLILTTTSLKDGFVPLAEAHNATGVRTIIRTLTDAGGTDTETIRNYIRDMYTTMGISYVLLGGDDPVVPERILWVMGMDENVTEYEDYLPADIYYACLDGPYNYDGDGKWGEPNDGEGGGDVDLMAEVYVGRACVDNVADVQAFVTKTISYMNSSDDPYMTKTLLAGEYLGDYGIASYSSSYLEQLVNGSDADGYTTVGIPSSEYQVDRLYDSEFYYWDPSELMAKINSGVHFINHLGHASFDYNMKMYESDVDDLTNTKYCFIYSQGCDSGGFDNPYGYDCIAEEFTAKTMHGAFAGIWNARYGFFWSFSTDGDNQRLHRQFWDAVFGENKTTVGAANHDSKEDNLFILHRSCIRWVIYETNLFGDPAVNLLNSTSPPPPPPPPPDPVLSIVSASGGARVLHLTVKNIGEVSAENISWTATVSGGIFHRIGISLNGTPFTVDVNESITVNATLPLFGLGKVSVDTTVEYAAPWNGTGFVLGPYLLKVTQS